MSRARFTEAPSPHSSRRVFAGRRPELAVLADELMRARAGSLRVALVTGEAGIGKSALVAQVSSRASADVLVLSARGHDFAASTPFGLWIEALERHLRSLDAAAVRRLVGRAAADLAPLLRSVEAADPGQAVSRASSYRLVESLVSLVAAVAARGPVVVAFDDIHFADVASLETVRFLARDRPALPLLVVMTARRDELADNPVARDVVFALEQDGLLQRLRLGPLTRDELGELARQRSGRDVVPERLVGWLEERSRGNALYATGLLLTLLDTGGDLERPALASVPEELSERVRARLDALDDADRQAVELLAVLGGRTELGDLARIAGRAVEQLAVSIDGLVRRRLVAEHSAGPVATFELVHPLVQDAIYESISGGRRAQLHRAVGRTLLASGDLGAAAAHLARSASPGDPEAVDALVAALRQAEEHALYRDVTAILGELLRLLPAGDGRWLDAASVMDPRADWVIAHLAEEGVHDAYEAMRRVEPLAERSDDHRLQGLVQMRLACFAGIGVGQLAGALAACEKAAGRFDLAGETELALLARSEASFIMTVRGEHRRAVTNTDALLPAAEELCDTQTLLHLLMHLSFALPYLGDHDNAGSAELRAMQLADETGNHYRLALFRNRHRCLLANVGRLDEARSLAAGTWDSPAAADALADENEVVIDWLAGDLDAALRAMAKCRARNREGVSLRQVQYLAFGVHAAAAADRLDGLDALVDRMQTLTRGVPGVWGCLASWAAGVLAWRRGEPDAVDELLVACEQIRARAVPMESLYFLADLAEAASERGRADHAGWAAAEVAAVGGVARFPFAVALGRLVVATANRDLGAAEAAVATFDELGYRLFLGRAQLTRGRALAAVDPRAAARAVEDALVTFRACGAAWQERRSVDVLRELGVRDRRRAAAAGPDSLSTRELEVARLAAEGLTAREIADAIIIGERTVETHLRNAYAKLGVRSKRELVQRGAELGLRT